MSYIPDLQTHRQVPVDGDALSVRAFPAASVSAFGTLMTSPETVIVELQFPYGLLREHLNISGCNGGYVSSSNGHAVVNAGGIANGYASIESKAANHYVAGTGGRLKFAGYFVSGGLTESTQEVGIGDSQDGYFFGYSGSLFGVCRRSSGIDTWTPQLSWSIDAMDGRGSSGQTLDPTKGNVYQIGYQWLGYGAITFLIEDVGTGLLWPVHRIGYANANTATSVRDPNLPIRMAVRQWGGSGSMAIHVSSICAMIEGFQPTHGLRRGVHTIKTAVSAEVPALTIQVSESFNGRTNRMRSLIDSLSISSRDNTNQTSYRVILNADLTNFSYAPVSASNSPMNVDFSATGSSGGREIFFIAIGPNGHDFIDLVSRQVRINPGDTLTVLASGSNSTCVAGLSWLEEL